MSIAACGHVWWRGVAAVANTTAAHNILNSHCNTINTNPTNHQAHPLLPCCTAAQLDRNALS